MEKREGKPLKISSPSSFSQSSLSALCWYPDWSVWPFPAQRVCHLSASHFTNLKRILLYFLTSFFPAAFTCRNLTFSRGEAQRASHSFGGFLVYNCDIESIIGEHVVLLWYCQLSGVSSDVLLAWSHTFVHSSPCCTLTQSSPHWMDRMQLWSITSIALSCFSYPLLLARPYLGLNMLIPLYSVRPNLMSLEHGQNG